MNRLAYSAMAVCLAFLMLLMASCTPADGGLETYPDDQTSAPAATSPDETDSRVDTIPDFTVLDMDGNEVKLSDFFLTNYTNAGRQSISCSIISTDEITLPLQQTELKTVTLASLRGDCIVSALFSISRSKASELIEKGRVFVNDVPFLKPDRPLNSGDKVKVTKSGRAYIE